MLACFSLSFAWIRRASVLHHGVHHAIMVCNGVVNVLVGTFVVNVVHRSATISVVLDVRIGEPVMCVFSCVTFGHDYHPPSFSAPPFWLRSLNMWAFFCAFMSIGASRCASGFGRAL
jgi:hypothetical protein